MAGYYAVLAVLLLYSFTAWPPVLCQTKDCVNSGNCQAVKVRFFQDGCQTATACQSAFVVTMRGPLSSGTKVIKLFSCSTQLSIKFQLLIKN